MGRYGNSDVCDTNVGDTISRQDAIDVLKRNYPSSCFEDLCKAVDIAIKALSADTQLTRKTAEWVYGEKDGADGWYCSECKFHIPWYYNYYGLENIDFIRDFHTCPHCDAKMMRYTGMKE